MENNTDSQYPVRQYLEKIIRDDFLAHNGLNLDDVKINETPTHMMLGSLYEPPKPETHIEYSEGIPVNWSSVSVSVDCPIVKPKKKSFLEKLKYFFTVKIVYQPEFRWRIDRTDEFIFFRFLWGFGEKSSGFKGYDGKLSFGFMRKRKIKGWKRVFQFYPSYQEWRLKVLGFHIHYVGY